MVPNTRIGGKCFTVSRPALFRAEYATELARPIVGIKNATEHVYKANSGPNSTAPSANAQ